MPKIANVASLVKRDAQKRIDAKKAQEAQRKIAEKVKNDAEMRELYRKVFGEVNFRTQYKVVTVDELPPADIYVRNLKQEMGNPEFQTYAPWNPVFRPYTPIITTSR